MRVLTWGIVVLFGLALGLSAMRVHGSRDERAAIRLAMRAPFADLRRRDAQRLCDDLTPAVDARLAPGTGGCDTQVGVPPFAWRATPPCTLRRQNPPLLRDRAC
jgi:hypothetical protein